MKSFSQTSEITKQYYISTGMKHCFYTLWYWMVTPVKSSEVYIKNISLDRESTLEWIIETFEDISNREEAEAMIDMDAPCKPADRMYTIEGHEAIWFGKHKGTAIVDFPEDETTYLCWLVNEAAKGGYWKTLSPEKEYINFRGQRITEEYCDIADKPWKKKIVRAAELEAIRRGAVYVSGNPWKLEDESTVLLYGSQLEKHIEKVNKAREIRMTSKHVGTVGESADLVLTVNNIITGEGEFGTWNLYVMQDGIGNVFTKFGTIGWKFVTNWAENDWSFEVKKGHVLKLNADIKNHDIREGVAQTQIGRVRKQKADKSFAARAKAHDAAFEASKNDRKIAAIVEKIKGTGISHDELAVVLDAAGNPEKVYKLDAVEKANENRLAFPRSNSQPINFLLASKWLKIIGK
jgi:hypothetical protein